MNQNLRLFTCLAALAIFAPNGFAAAETKPGANPPAHKAGAAAKRHPLKGVVTGVDANLAAIRVKHEEIPGVMRAMTMLFKVDDATLKAVKAGDAITALMAREEGEWRLYDVKVVPAAKK